ncbi:MAG: electron transfer flavoprotein subunit beta/FixA family protein [Syntrophomonadaceae bacterium]|jgi:electron transfer flavoprotein beta subunit|nr:electron transfer flavoprotein subunit beta/FixA family protein [Syntrophomonadaceae bacterium]
MPNIVCCFKWVVDEAYIKPSSSGKIDLEWAEHKLSDYDRNAIEEAVRLQEAYGGSVTAVTVAPSDATKGIKDALSRGPEKAYFINSEELENLEPSQTSAILAQVIAQQIDYDLIICGEGSSDLYAQQVGPRLAEKLRIPCIAFVKKVEIDGGRLIAERKSDDGIEVVSAPLPALITVLPDINNPRVPGLKDTLAASKKPVEEISLEDLDTEYPALIIDKGLRAASLVRNCTRFGSTPEDIQAFVEAIKKTGIIDRG